jgi:hypothetical protein
MVSWRGWGTLRSKTLSLLVGALAGLSSACEGEGPSVMIISHLVSDEPPVPWSYQCSGVDVDGASTASGNTNDEFWSRESIGDGRVEIVAGTKDEVIGRKVYDLRFVQSGKSDRFTVQAPNGDIWTWVTWGGNECERCPPPPYEPLPGDVSDCGSATTP